MIQIWQNISVEYCLQTHTHMVVSFSVTETLQLPTAPADHKHSSVSVSDRNTGLCLSVWTQQSWEKTLSWELADVYIN